MNREDILQLAREAGFRVGPSRDGPDDVWGVGANLERFAALVAAAAKAEEREACAKVVNDDRGLSDDDAIRVMRAIRARGNT